MVSFILEVTTTSKLEPNQLADSLPWLRMEHSHPGQPAQADSTCNKPPLGPRTLGTGWGPVLPAGVRSPASPVPAYSPSGNTSEIASSQGVFILAWVPPTFPSQPLKGSPCIRGCLQQLHGALDFICLGNFLLMPLLAQHRLHIPLRTVLKCLILSLHIPIPCLTDQFNRVPKSPVTIPTTTVSNLHHNPNDFCSA